MFHLIVELVAIVPKKFDAVIFVGIMGSRENNSGVSAKRPRNVGNTRSRERTDNENIDAEGRDSRHQRVLEHVTRKPRVFSEDNFGTRAFRVLARIKLRENVRGGAAKLQGCFGRDRLDVGNTADAIRPEDFLLLSHGLIELLET